MVNCNPVMPSITISKLNLWLLIEVVGQKKRSKQLEKQQQQRAESHSRHRQIADERSDSNANLRMALVVKQMYTVWL